MAKGVDRGAELVLSSVLTLVMTNDETNLRETEVTGVSVRTWEAVSPPSAMRAM